MSTKKSLETVLEADRSDINRYKMATKFKRCCLKIQYWVKPIMSSYSDNPGIVLKSVTETGVGLPHDLRSNYSDMLRLVGSTTEQAHCYVCDCERQAAPILSQCQRSSQQINRQSFMLDDSPHTHN